MQKTQSAISFSIPNGFTYSTIYAAFNALIQALQVYWFFNSIIQYNSDPANSNQGMRYLRQCMTANDINSYVLLREAIARMPCPPNLKQFVFYLNQTYCSGDIPGCSLIKISPVEFFNNNGNICPATSSIDAATKKLYDYAPVWNILSRACPNWISPSVWNTCIVPAYDQEFLTIFANLPYTGIKAGENGYSFNGPKVQSFTQDINYFSYTNELDGGAFSLTSIIYENIDTSTEKLMPGFMIPQPSTIATDITSNRFSFVSGLGITGGFADVFSSDSKSYLNRGETYCINGILNLNNNELKPGSQLCFGVNTQTVGQTCAKLLRFLFDTSSIKPAVDKRFQKNNFGNKGKK